VRALLLAGMIAIASHTAFADGAGVIAASTDDRGAVEAAMVDAMAGRARRVVPDAVAGARVAVAAGAVPVDALARFRRVREQVDEGWRAYLRVAVEVAGNGRVRPHEAEQLSGCPVVRGLRCSATVGAVLGHPGRSRNHRWCSRSRGTRSRPLIMLAEFSPDAVDPSRRRAR
jgi:hypothetical protein